MSALPLIMALVAAEATIPAPTVAPRSDGVLVPATVGLDCLVVTSSGGRWSGRVTLVRKDLIVVHIDEDREVHVPPDRLRGVIPQTWLDDDTVPHGTLKRGAGPDVRLLLADGEVVRGLVVERSTERLVLEGPGEARRDIPVGEVLAEVKLLEERQPPSGRTRYLEAPSAVLPVAGLTELRSTEVVHVSVEHGITDHVSVSAGTVIAALHGVDYSSNAQAAVRSGRSLGESWHLAAGLHLSVSGSGRATGYLSATATWSSPKASVTLHAGPAFPGLNRLSDLGETGAALALGYRLSPRVAVISETWIGLRGDGVFSAVAARWTARRLTVDAGVAAASGGHGPVPWLGIAVEVDQ
jgi:hypothetical protein